MNRWIWSLLLVLLMVAPAQCEPTFTLTGTIIDLAGAPVAEAEVYLYRSANTRRPADFISARTAADGKYRLVLPAGSYWGVARIKGGERFGPLQIGQRHSGEPLPITVGEEPITTTDFMVADLKEMAQKRQKLNPEVTSISGVISDRDGKPMANAYAFARSGQLQATLPEYISAWTGADGRFTLYLPPGDYYWGAAQTFPPPIVPQLLKAPAADGKPELQLLLAE